MLEFKLENNLACKDKFKFFTHGGMLWLFSTSIVFACVSFTLPQTVCHYYGWLTNDESEFHTGVCCHFLDLFVRPSQTLGLTL